MSGSFDRIDYTVRPAKYAERRMLRDIFRRVSPFASPEDYVYVGFGSVWFADFSLFHRGLGVREMVSIESSVKAVQRVTDNAPFNISLKFDRSERVLPTLDWSRLQFMWLDYDDAIDPNKLRDVDFVARKARSGSLLAVTVRASEAKEYDPTGDIGASTASFRQKFDPGLYPAEIDDGDLMGYPFCTLSRSMLQTKIEDALDVRNSKADDPVRFQPICSIDYADGVLMTTLVGMFHSESDAQRMTECGFDRLDFLPALGSIIRIEVPLMTPREIRLIESQLPLVDGQELDIGSIPEKQVERLVKLYRHLPAFMVAEA